MEGAPLGVTVCDKKGGKGVVLRTYYIHVRSSPRQAISSRVIGKDEIPAHHQRTKYIQRSDGSFSHPRLLRQQSLHVRNCSRWLLIYQVSLDSPLTPIAVIGIGIGCWQRVRPCTGWLSAGCDLHSGTWQAHEQLSGNAVLFEPLNTKVKIGLLSEQYGLNRYWSDSELIQGRCILQSVFQWFSWLTFRMSLMVPRLCITIQYSALRCNNLVNLREGFRLAWHNYAGVDRTWQFVTGRREGLKLTKTSVT